MAISLASLKNSIANNGFLSSAGNIISDAIKDAELIKDNKLPVPNKLLTRDKIKNSNSVTSYKCHWAITLEKLGKYSISNPFSLYHMKAKGDYGLELEDNLLPATSFRYDTYKSSNDEISLANGFSISVPGGYSYNKTLTVSLFNDCQDAVREYLRAYRKSISPSFKTVRPYKECCSKLTLWIYNAFLVLMDKYELWVIPDCSDPDISDNSPKSLDITYNILGESDSNPAI